MRRYRTFVCDSARWDGFVHRPGDIVISTPAKCGTTWMQMCVALLVFGTPEFGRPLAEVSPWLDMQTRSRADVVALLDAQGHRRFIKTHTPRDGLPFDERVQYVVVGRDLRDVAMSWDGHVANSSLDALVTARVNAVGLDDIAELGPPPGPPPDDPVERFWRWVDSDDPIEVNLWSLASALHHLRSWWTVRDLPNVELFHYRDMVDDLPREMRRLRDFLGIERSDDEVARLATEATFDQMKRRADDVVPDVSNAIWQDNARFFEEGPKRDWTSVLRDDGSVKRYEARAATLASHELLAWVHR